ncbi:MAG: hypothetical protein ACKVY0_20415 [Prosthecobacter sp.]|uniref:hypothetical protein n=1 Tax=Prosthecobacter sp. TaxID=1965333 RepID=UPI0038FE6C74
MLLQTFLSPPGPEVIKMGVFAADSGKPPIVFCLVICGFPESAANPPFHGM